MQYPGSAHVLEREEGPRHSSLGQESLVVKGFKAGVAAPATLQPHTALRTFLNASFLGPLASRTLQYGLN